MDGANLAFRPSWPPRRRTKSGLAGDGSEGASGFWIGSGGSESRGEKVSCTYRSEGEREGKKLFTEEKLLKANNQ